MTNTGNPMANTGNPVNDVQNINPGTVSEEQVLLTERAKDILEVLQKEPKVNLVPFLRFTEHGVTPDVRLSVVKQKKDEPSKTDEGDGGADADGGKEESATEQPTEA